MNLEILCSFCESKFICCATGIYHSISTNIDNSHFSSVKKLFRFKLISCLQFLWFFNRHPTTHHTTIVYRIDKRYLIFNEKILNKKLFS